PFVFLTWYYRRRNSPKQESPATTTVPRDTRVLPVPHPPASTPPVLPKLNSPPRAASRSPGECPPSDSPPPRARSRAARDIPRRAAHPETRAAEPPRFRTEPRAP